MFDWEELRQVNHIIEQLRETNKTTDKISILSANKDHILLSKVLYYTYDSRLKYGIQKKNLTSKASQKGSMTFSDPFKMLDVLAESNINNDLLASVKYYLYQNVPEDLQELVKMIILKDLKIKINATTINKVFKGLIYEFSCQLGQPIEKAKIADGEKIYITKKLNGTRCIYMNGTLYARSGKEINGFQNIKDEIKQLGINNMVLDGELVRINRGNRIDDEDNFRLSLSIINSKERTAEEEDQIEYVLFDILLTSEFIKGKSIMTYSQRRELLDKLNTKGLKHLRVTKILYQGTYTRAKADKLLEMADQRGYEGLMCNLDAPYECKRVKTLLKMKTFKFNDVKIIGFEESEKIPNTLGSIIVDYKGFPCGVGSGYTQEERDYIWNHQDEYLGRVCCVKCKLESKNNKGELSMNFPIWQCLREEGKEVSYES